MTRGPCHQAGTSGRGKVKEAVTVCVCGGGLQLCKLRCPRQDRDSSISLDRALSSSPCQTHHWGQRVLAPKPHQDPSIPLCPYPLHHSNSHLLSLTLGSPPIRGPRAFLTSESLLPGLRMLPLAPPTWSSAVRPTLIPSLVPTTPRLCFCCAGSRSHPH